MSFWSVLGTIGAGVATAVTGGAAAPLIPIAASIGQAVDSRNAEKDAAKQQQAAYGRIADIYQPFYQGGGQAFNALAQGFGLEGANFSGGLMPGGGGGGAFVDPRTQGLGGAFDRMNAGAAQRSAIPQNSTAIVEPSMSSGRLADLVTASAKKRNSSSYAQQKES